MSKKIILGILIFFVEYLLLVSSNLFFLLLAVFFFYFLIKESWAHSIGLAILLLMLYPGLSQFAIRSSLFSISRVNFSILFLIWLFQNISLKNSIHSKIRLIQNDSKLWIVLLTAFSISAIFNFGFSGLRNVLLYWGFVFGMYFVYSRKINKIDDLTIIGKYLVVGLVFVFFASVYEFITFQRFYTLFPSIFNSMKIIDPSVQLRENLGRATVFAQHSSSLSHIIALLSILLLYIYDVTKKNIFFNAFILGVLVIFLTQAKTGLLILVFISILRMTSYKNVFISLIAFIFVFVIGTIISSQLGVDLISNFYINILATIFPYSGYTSGQAYNSIGRVDLFMQFYDWSSSNSIFGLGEKGVEWSSWADANKFTSILFQFGIFGLVFWIYFWIKPLFSSFRYLLKNKKERDTTVFFILSILAFITGYFSTYFPEPDFLIMLPFAIFANRAILVNDKTLKINKGKPCEPN